MTLNLAAVGKQIRQMADNLASSERRTVDLLREAVRQLADSPDDFHELRDRVEASKTGWPIARPLEPPGRRTPLPAVPGTYTVVASDGSQIEPDRHGPALCYLINIGSALISYGETPRALLESEPTLGFGDHDLYITPGDDKRRTLVEAHILDARRDVLEGRTLAEKTCPIVAQATTVAVRDGSLRLRTGEGWGEKYIRETLLPEYLASLDEMRKCGVPVCSYASRPRSTDVVNLLCLLRCPHPIADCRQSCPNAALRDTQPCATLASLLDGEVFKAHLETGERSALFLSPSSSAQESYQHHQLCFFYVNVGREIARVEIPKWLADNADYVDAVHAVLFDQCRRGGGYPRALIEAHEKAVMSSAERREFQDLLESVLTNRGVRYIASEKERSKRLRGL